MATQLYWLVALLALAACCSGIPVSVMLQLDTFNYQGGLNNPSKLTGQLQQLKSGGVDGVMVDVWWGLTEPIAHQYNFSGVIALASLCRQNNLTLQLVTSFHKCGTNVGDTYVVPLPQWVLDVAGIFYTDREGSADDEYLSLGIDNQRLFGGRSPIDIYSDFFVALRNSLEQFMPKTVNEVQVGLGPAGELRYPGYQLGKWSYCGIGEFQCYDKYMLYSLKQAAAAAGHPEWGNSGPANAGNYNSQPPSNTGFFADGGFNNYASPYGQFFLNWYSQSLIQHGDSILAKAKAVFPSGVHIAAKISGIHWWYSTASHAAEATSGYYNTNNQNGYLNLAKMFAKYNAVFDFTCLEMFNSDSCGSAPQTLVGQTQQAAKQAGIAFSGENALEVCNPGCNSALFNQILAQSTANGPISRFTYLRLTDNLLSNNYNNWNTFRGFINQMRNAN